MMKRTNRGTDFYSVYQFMESEKMAGAIRYFDSLQSKPLRSYITPEDNLYIHKLAMVHTSVKEMYEEIGHLLYNRGFILVGGGTNRRAYRHYNDNVIIKVATDTGGINANRREIRSQRLLKPFCTKIYEVSNDNTISLCELGNPFKKYKDFLEYDKDVSNILFFRIRENDIIAEDIGKKSWKNWCTVYRPYVNELIGKNGYVPALCDFPTVYKGDVRKMRCNHINNGKICNGSLDYDAGYVNIVCNDCKRVVLTDSMVADDDDDDKHPPNVVGYNGPNNRVRVKFKLTDGINSETHRIIGESDYVI